MARPLRICIAGGVYHAIARGNERAPIYRDDADRFAFLRMLARVVDRFGWLCHAYCLMGNHYHLVVRTPIPNLSRGMMLINSCYAHRFNVGGEPGHVFQGRFRSVLVRTVGHLLIVIKYVLRNPVTAGLCEDPKDWLWSSYASTVDMRPTKQLIAVQATLAWFGDDEESPHRFAEFICNGAMDPIDDAVAADLELPTEPGAADQQRPPIEALLARHAGASGIALAYHRHGYSLTEIAQALGCSRSTVGRRLVSYESRHMLESASWPRTNPG